jgi:MYND finger
MAKAKKGKKGAKSLQKKTDETSQGSSTSTINGPSSSTFTPSTIAKAANDGVPSLVSDINKMVPSFSFGSSINNEFSPNDITTGNTGINLTTNGGGVGTMEDRDDLTWLRECDTRVDTKGQPYLQLEYRDDDTIMLYLKNFLEKSSAQKQVVEEFYQIWQQTVLSTLLEMSAVWQKENVTPDDQRHMKERLKKARYKISFLLHRVMGGMLTSTLAKWQNRRDELLHVCFQTLLLLPRLAESCPHHKSDIRQVIIHFEGKEFLASCACETWDTLYDHSIPLDPRFFVPILRRCAMLDILDKDWNMLGGWEDILKALEAKCFMDTGPVPRLTSDAVLQETTTILRNARNSMQCKFFSVRFLRYTDDQAPQRWRYFPKCSAPACANLETPQKPHTLRCTHCWYFHYCSSSCQEYCDNIMGLHPKFCKDTPRDKAAQCQKEMEQYLGLNQEPDMTCHACGLEEQHIMEGTEGMKRCSQCQKVYYCSRQCQEWDWRVGGHKQVCKEISETLLMDTDGASAGMQGNGTME